MSILREKYIHPVLRSPKSQSITASTQGPRCHPLNQLSQEWGYTEPQLGVSTLAFLTELHKSLYMVAAGGLRATEVLFVDSAWLAA